MFNIVLHFHAIQPALDWWVVAFGTARRGLGEVACLLGYTCPGSIILFAVPNVTVLLSRTAAPITILLIVVF